MRPAAATAQSHGVPIRPGLFEAGPGGPWFLGSRCQRCGSAFWPSRSACGRCGTPDPAPERLGPEGSLWSYTIVHQAPGGFTGPVPYVLSIARFAGEVKIHGHLACDPASVPPLDSPVWLAVEPVGRRPDGVPILGWRFYPLTGAPKGSGRSRT